MNTIVIKKYYCYNFDPRRTVSEDLFSTAAHNTVHFNTDHVVDEWARSLPS